MDRSPVRGVYLFVYLYVYLFTQVVPTGTAIPLARLVSSTRLWYQTVQEKQRWVSAAFWHLRCSRGSCLTWYGGCARLGSSLLCLELFISRCLKRVDTRPVRSVMELKITATLAGCAVQMGHESDLLLCASFNSRRAFQWRHHSQPILRANDKAREDALLLGWRVWWIIVTERVCRSGIALEACFHNSQELTSWTQWTMSYLFNL